MFFQGSKRRERQRAGGRPGSLPWQTTGRHGPRHAATAGPGRFDGDTAEMPPDGSPDGAVLAPAADVDREAGPASGVDVDLKAHIGTATFAFRGFDVSNLGRSPELLAHPAYGPVVRRFLDEASEVSAETLRRKVDLAARVEAGESGGLTSFAEDVALIVAMQLAQLALLEQFHGADPRAAKQSFGYSIGELAALVNGGVFTLGQILPIPIACADDCAALAEGTHLGVVFSRGPALSLKDLQELCVGVSSEGNGMIGVSAYLSPNTMLVMGQGDTLDRLEKEIPGRMPPKTMLRRKLHKLPPLHTPLVWQKNIPNRAAVALYRTGGGHAPPRPRVVSCVTGAASYDGLNARDTLIRWVDHPQLLWDAISETLVSGSDLVIHAGPAPNLIPATFERLSNNVNKQLGNRYFQMIGRGFGSSMQKRAWLARLLPTKAALLRAPQLRHVILEDWLLDREVG
jgi:[acyl-carrier-protein] S-malonyltransferase